MPTEREIEAAAKAMWEANPHHPNWTWEDCHPRFDQQVWRVKAKIALEGAERVREPDRQVARLREALAMIETAETTVPSEVLREVARAALADERVADSSGSEPGEQGASMGADATTARSTVASAPTNSAAWNAAIEAAATVAIERGDMLDIHGPRIAAAIRALARGDAPVPADSSDIGSERE